MYYEVKNSNIQHHFLNVKISAIIKDTHLKYSVIILDITREGTALRFLICGIVFILFYAM